MANVIGHTPQSVFLMAKRGWLTAEHGECLRIEEASFGHIRPWELRPDVYREPAKRGKKGCPKRR